MPRPKERKRRERNKQRHWLNEFEDFRRRFENGGEKEGNRRRKEKSKQKEEE